MVDYNGLENRRTERYRGFESLSLRKSLLKEISEGFFHFHTFTIKKLIILSQSQKFAQHQSLKYERRNLLPNSTTQPRETTNKPIALITAPYTWS